MHFCLGTRVPRHSAEVTDSGGGTAHATIRGLPIRSKRLLDKGLTLLLLQSDILLAVTARADLGGGLWGLQPPPPPPPQ